MWIGNLSAIEECSLLSKKDVEQIKRFFQKNDMQTLPLGKYALSENNFVNVFEYVTQENNGSYEAHKKYVDIHYVIKGEERVFYAENFAEMKQCYDQSKDYSLGMVEDEKSVSLINGEILIFDIDEPHKAGVLLDSSSYVKKAVFKIEVKKNFKP